jgi:cyanophycinase
MSGVLALVGGGEWSDGCTFDARFLEQSGGAEVVVLATAAAYENPAKAVAKATTWFEGLGATVVAPEVLGRRDAFDSDHLDVIRGARSCTSLMAGRCTCGRCSRNRRCSRP